jgi:hypothetical protein
LIQVGCAPGRLLFPRNGAECDRSSNPSDIGRLYKNFGISRLYTDITTAPAPNILAFVLLSSRRIIVRQDGLLWPSPPAIKDEASHDGVKGFSLEDRQLIPA